MLLVCAAVVLGHTWAKGRCTSVGGSEQQRCTRGGGGGGVGVQVGVGLRMGGAQ